MKKKIFITRNILPLGIELLKENQFEVEVSEFDGPIPRIILEQKAKESHGLITMLNDSIDANFLRSNSHLKIISNYAVGFNNIDIEAATINSIVVANTPDVLTKSTAEIAMGLMIVSMRNISISHLALMNNEFSGFNPHGFLGHSLWGKTLGIIGMGRIGEAFAKMAKNAFDMNIIYFNRSIKKTFLGEQVELEFLLKNSDVISMHVPMNQETNEMIGIKEFQLMKKSAVFINTARGEVVNQDALFTALNNKFIFAAGLDVTTPEPLESGSPLLGLNNLFILPHVGSATYEARNEMSKMCAQNIINVFKNLRPLGDVNFDQVYLKKSF
jgi:glyoxylate reductase